MKDDLKGRTYLATEGPYAGEMITIHGIDPLFPSGRRWMVEAECGTRWSVWKDFLVDVLAQQATDQS